MYSNKGRHFKDIIDIQIIFKQSIFFIKYLKHQIILFYCKFCENKDGTSSRIYWQLRKISFHEWQIGEVTIL